MNEIIAEREIIAVSSKGEKKIVHLVLGKPYQVNDVSWACSVQVEGLHKDLRDIVGCDSWQALSLALSFIRQLLGYCLEDGCKIFGKEDGDEISLSDLFPQ